jgi:hypothetical protein
MTKVSRLQVLAFALLSLAVVSCGGSGGGAAAGASGVDGSKAINALTSAEKAKFCDWTNATAGGYNKSYDCGMGLTASTDADQAECLSTWPTCSVTVVMMEACVKAIGTNFCGVLTGTTLPPGCLPVADCL